MSGKGRARAPTVIVASPPTASASSASVQSASTCGRDTDPQECYLVPGNIFHRYSSKYFWGPKNSSWGLESRGGRARGPGSSRRAVPRGSRRTCGQNRARPQISSAGIA
jgi:hypothetical protein